MTSLLSLLCQAFNLPFIIFLVGSLACCISLVFTVTRKTHQIKNSAQSVRDIYLYESSHSFKPVAREKRIIGKRFIGGFMFSVQEISQTVKDSGRKSIGVMA